MNLTQQQINAAMLAASRWYKQTHYHNTTGVDGELLAEYENKAKSQEEKIFFWWLKNRGMHTPSKVWREVFRQSPAIRATVPLTSVRRAITNLTKAGLLKKTMIVTDGEYGRPESKWKLSGEYEYWQHDLFEMGRDDSKGVRLDPVMRAAL